MKKTHLRFTAESSPFSRLLRIDFWYKQRDFLTIILVTVLISPFLLKFSYEKIDELTLTSIFNAIIHSLAIWAIINTVKILAEIDVENTIVKYIESEGIDYLGKLQRSGRNQLQRRDLNFISQNFVPNNKTTPPLAMTRLFQRICKEAKDRKFESSIYLIQPYREESSEKIAEISNIQKIALRLGILGTFTGLILAISKLTIYPTNEINNENFSELITGLFSDLYISFSTSISGLEVAILVSFLIMALRNKQKVYFREMEEAVITMLSVVRNSINKDDFLVEFQQVYRVVNELENKIYDHGHRITASVQNVENKIVSQTNQIKEGIDELIQVKSEFDSFLNELTETQKQFIDETQKVYNIISPYKISEELRSGILQAGVSVAERVQETENTIDNQTKTIQQGISKLDKTQKEFNIFLDDISKSQNKFLNNLRNSYDIAPIQMISNELKLAINQSEANLSNNLSSNLENLSNTIKQLKQSLESHAKFVKMVTYEIQRERRRSLLSRFF